MKSIISTHLLFHLLVLPFTVEAAVATTSGAGSGGVSGSTGIIIIVVGVVLFIAISLLLYFLLFRGRKRPVPAAAATKAAIPPQDPKKTLSNKELEQVKVVEDPKLSTPNPDMTFANASNGNMPIASSSAADLADQPGGASNPNSGLGSRISLERNAAASQVRLTKSAYTSAANIQNQLNNNSLSPSAANLGSALFNLGPSKSIPPSQMSLNRSSDLSGSASMNASQNLEIEGPGGTGITKLPAELKKHRPPTNLSPNRQFRISKVEEFLASAQSAQANIGSDSNMKLSPSGSSPISPIQATSPIPQSKSPSQPQQQPKKEHQDERDFGSDLDMKDSDGGGSDEDGKLEKEKSRSRSNSKNLDPETRKSISKVELWLRSNSIVNSQSGEGLVGGGSGGKESSNSQSDLKKEKFKSISNVKAIAEESSEKESTDSIPQGLKRGTAKSTPFIEQHQSVPAAKKEPVVVEVKKDTKIAESSNVKSSSPEKSTDVPVVEKSTALANTSTPSDPVPVAAAEASKNSGSEESVKSTRSVSKKPLKSALSQKSVNNNTAAVVPAPAPAPADEQPASPAPERGALKRKNSVSIPDKHTTIVEYNKFERTIDMMASVIPAPTAETEDTFHDAPKGPSDDEDDDDDDDDGGFPDTHIPTI